MSIKPQLKAMFAAALTLFPLALSGCEYLLDDGAYGEDYGDDSDQASSNLLRSAEVVTTENNGNKRIEPGETTSPKAHFYPKDTCVEDVILDWQACLFEADQWGWEWISVTLDGTVMCGAFETRLDCVDENLQQGKTICLGGFCDYVMEDSSPTNCGWKITDLTAKNGNGDVLEWFTPEFLDSLGYHLLPVD